MCTSIHTYMVYIPWYLHIPRLFLQCPSWVSTSVNVIEPPEHWGMKTLYTTISWILAKRSSAPENGWWLIMVGSWKMWIVFPFLGWKVAQGKGAGSDYVWVSGSVLNSRELEVGWSLWGQRHHLESGLPRDDDASTCLCMEGCCGWAFDSGRWWYPSVTWGLK